MPSVETETKSEYIAGLRRGTTASSKELRRRIERVPGVTIVAQGYAVVKFLASQSISRAVAEQIDDIGVVENNDAVFRPASLAYR